MKAVFKNNKNSTRDHHKRPKLDADDAGNHCLMLSALGMRGSAWKLVGLMSTDSIYPALGEPRYGRILL